MRFRRKVKFYN